MSMASAGGACMGNPVRLGLALAGGDLLVATAAADAAVPAPAGVPLLAAGHGQDAGGAGAADWDSPHERAGASAWAPAACRRTQGKGEAQVCRASVDTKF